MSDSKARLFAAVHVSEHFYSLVSATGVVDALEQVGEAPDGALLLTDTDDGSQGRIMAESMRGGWELRAVMDERGDFLTLDEEDSQ